MAVDDHPPQPAVLAHYDSFADDGFLHRGAGRMTQFRERTDDSTVVPSTLLPSAERVLCTLQV